MSRIRIISAVLLLSTVGLTVNGDTFVNRKTGRVGKGRVLLRETKEGRERILVEGDTGKIGWIWADEWEVIEAPAAQPRQPTESAKAARESQLAEVYATGLGTTPEDAEQDAFARAVEMTVGVLVDAETIVENDQLIKDKVLTHSRGFVHQFKVLRRFEHEGAHHADVWAKVGVNSLHERLKAPEVAVVPVDGKLIFRQELLDEENRRNAAAMVRAVLEDAWMDKLVKVTILNDSQAERIRTSEGQIQFPVRMQVSVDSNEYKKLRGDLLSLLATIAYSRADFTIRAQKPTNEQWYIGSVPVGESERLWRRLRAPARAPAANIVCLCEALLPSGAVSKWKAFLVDQSICDELADLYHRECQLRVALLDETGGIVEQQRRPLVAKQLDLSGDPFASANRGSQPPFGSVGTQSKVVPIRLVGYVRVAQQAAHRDDPFAHPGGNYTYVDVGPSLGPCVWCPCSSRGAENPHSYSPGFEIEDTINTDIAVPLLC